LKTNNLGASSALDARPPEAPAQTVNCQPSTVKLIAIDWGTTSARAYALDAAGHIGGTRSAPLGVQQLASADFPRALSELLGEWAALDVPRFAAGMIGSRQGWVEAPYVACPAGFDALAGNLAWTPARELAIVPGLIWRDRGGVPDVMRGEETQLAGAITDADDAVLAVLPGTHSKWAQVVRGRVVAFQTHMTGELYAVLLAHSILGRLATPTSAASASGPAFAQGVARGLAGEGLGHAIFGARTLALTGELDSNAVPDWLSGVLIGHEIGAARQWARDRGVSATRVRVIGSDTLVTRYAAALAQAEFEVDAGPSDAAVRGLVRIAERAGYFR
jgi:2-dehydro-3-deoxygalactonokinase